VDNEVSIVPDNLLTNLDVIKLDSISKFPISYERSVTEPLISLAKRNVNTPLLSWKSIYLLGDLALEEIQGTCRKLKYNPERSVKMSQNTKDATSESSFMQEVRQTRKNYKVYDPLVKQGGVEYTVSMFGMPREVAQRFIKDGEIIIDFSEFAAVGDYIEKQITEKLDWISGNMAGTLELSEIAKIKNEIASLRYGYEQIKSVGANLELILDRMDDEEKRRKVRGRTRRQDSNTSSTPEASARVSFSNE